MTADEIRTAIQNGDGQALRRERYTLMDRFKSALQKALS